MNKTAIKNFAIWARNKLIKEITYKAGLVGITEKGIADALPQSNQSIQWFDIGISEPSQIQGIAIKQRKQLVEQIKEKQGEGDYQTAFKSVIEEVAYTWFNRLIAIRFMEVNDYLPSRVRVLSSEAEGKEEPDLVTNPFETDLEFSDEEMNFVMKCKEESRLDELFRILFIKQCNKLNEILPNLFEKTADYTEFLLNISYTDPEGVVYHLVHDIDEEDFCVKENEEGEVTGQVEIIGWLYQYYNTELKDETFALLKKNVKITKERIPAATQLFTPDWIVKYMVENSLGRLWAEGHPNEAIKKHWKYYLKEAEQEESVQKQLAEIRKEYSKLNPEDIKVMDPCMGSGHILVYAFDVLMQIYESCGYSQRDAAKSIVEHNLYGLDIDERAYQLAYFAVMMKARQYNRRILDCGVKCNLYAIKESNGINREHLQFFGSSLSEIERQTAIGELTTILDEMQDAKDYGSIIEVKPFNIELVKRFFESHNAREQMSLQNIGIEETQKRLIELINRAYILSIRYEVVITNPPYIGNMPVKMNEYVIEKYPLSKYDLYSVFIEKCLRFTSSNGYLSLITQHTWMFISSFEEFRTKILKNNIINILHLGTKAFEAIGGEVVQTAAYVVAKRMLNNYIITAKRLVEYDSAQKKCNQFFNQNNNYYVKTENFYKLHGIPIAYWLGNKYFEIIENFNKIEFYVERKAGVVTGNDSYFVRLWHEVNIEDISFIGLPKSNYSKYHLMQKGGGFRRYYGNNEYIIRLKDLYNPEKTNVSVRRGDEEYYFKKAIGWSQVGNRQKSFRLVNNSVCGTATPTIYLKDSSYFNYILAFLNTKIAFEYLNAYNPTINLLTTDICALPLYIDIRNKNKIDKIIENILSISKVDWDSFEASWDFSTHPLITYKCGASYADIPIEQWKYRIADAFQCWKSNAEEQFNIMKANEEELNYIFIEIYGLQDELTPEVEEKDITVRKADLTRDIKSFVSYAVGCMFGRYSLDPKGVIYAGGEWMASKYQTFIPTQDNILLITDEEYFSDDIVNRFIEFVKVVYGSETLEENLDFIAKALCKKGNTSREVIRNYFIKDFFKDHCKAYQNRPIYWLFDSGKQNGFKALIYMHRYNADTIGNVRIDYLHRLQKVYENEIIHMQEVMDNSNNAREVSAASKRKEKLTKQLQETREYDKKLAHLALARIEIDLDDGVKVNYEKVQTGTDGKKLDVLAKI